MLASSGKLKGHFFVVHIFDQLHTGLSIKIECLRTKVSNSRRCSNTKQREKSTAIILKQRHHAINDQNRGFLLLSRSIDVAHKRKGVLRIPAHNLDYLGGKNLLSVCTIGRVAVKNLIISSL
jgi:hypothetical protein